MNIIEVSGLTKVYSGRRGEVTALDNVSFSAEKGEFLAVVGPSGSGKSTLMNILGLLDIPSRGLYYLNGRKVNSLSPREQTDVRSRSVGFIFQNNNLISSLTALENVELPLLYRGLSKRQARLSAQKAIDRVGLFDRSGHLPSELSGGQRQRVAIARAVAGGAPLILADEPTGSLDPESGRGIIALLRSMVDAGHTVVMITHDRAAAQSSPVVIEITDGHIKREDYTNGT